MPTAGPSKAIRTHELENRAPQRPWWHATASPGSTTADESASSPTSPTTHPASPRNRGNSNTARRRYVAGHLALLSGRQSEAEALLRGAWDDADPVDEADVRCLASEQLAGLCALQVRPEDAIAWVRRAVDATADPSLGATALTTLVVYLALVGRPGEALPLVSSLPADPSRLTPRDRAGMLARGIVLTWMAELHEACADLSAVVSASHAALGSRTGLLALGYLAQAEYLLGGGPTACGTPNSPWRWPPTLDRRGCCPCSTPLLPGPFRPEGSGTPPSNTYRPRRPRQRESATR